MREWMILVIIITVILWIVLFPRHETHTFIRHEAVEVPSFKIEIDGEVMSPGIYECYEPMMVGDLVDFALGFSDDADLSKIDLTKTYSEDGYIYIPSLDIEEPTEQEKISINHASFMELLEIPGLQERQAANIIIYSQQYGLFKSLDELINVTYIGSKTLENIRLYITL